jgi:hypothetical protein
MKKNEAREAEPSRVPLINQIWCHVNKYWLNISNIERNLSVTDYHMPIILDFRPINGFAWDSFQNERKKTIHGLSGVINQAIINCLK